MRMKTNAERRTPNIELALTRPDTNRRKLRMSSRAGGDNGEVLAMASSSDGEQGEGICLARRRIEGGQSPTK